MNRLTLFTLISIFIFSCSSENEADSEGEELSRGGVGIELIPLYKTQLNLFDQVGEDSTVSEKLILTELFTPNATLLRDCFGYSDSSYVAAQREIFRNRMPEVESANAFFDSIGFAQLLQDYEQTFSAKTEHQATGKFYFSFFERRICNFCGCDRNTMQMDLLLTDNQDREYLKVLLPHEMNHNAFEIAQNDSLMQETILYKAIDEGFATLVSQILAEVTVDEAFGMTSTEFQWYSDNEMEIKDRVKPILLFTDEELWDPLSVKVSDSFMKGSPGNIGYFVGYRIVEEFLKTKEGEDRWKLVYSTPVNKIYEESGW